MYENCSIIIIFIFSINGIACKSRKIYAQEFISDGSYLFDALDVQRNTNLLLLSKLTEKTCLHESCVKLIRSSALLDLELLEISLSCKINDIFYDFWLALLLDFLMMASALFRCPVRQELGEPIENSFRSAQVLAGKFGFIEDKKIKIDEVFLSAPGSFAVVFAAWNSSLFP